jgi:hypothetical protein
MKVARYVRIILMMLRHVLGDHEVFDNADSKLADR